MLQLTKELERYLIKLCEEEDFEAIFPPINLCGDNAAMIAMVGLEKFKLNQFNGSRSAQQNLGGL